MNEDQLLILFALGPVVTGLALYMFFVVHRQHKQAGKLRWRLIVGNGLVLLFIVALLMAVGEGYYRFVYDTTDSFAQAKVTRRWFERYYHRNKMDMRDSVDEYHAQVQVGKRRVTFLGDSFTAGHGVADVEDRFANRMRTLRPGWEVHVFAKNGFDTGMHLMTLDIVAQMRNYQYDQVILVYCVNDISDMIEAWQQKLERINKAPAPNFLIENSYLFNTMYYRYQAASDPDLSDYYRCVIDAYEGPLWNIQMARLTEIRDRVHAQGGSLSVVTFPFLHTLGPDNPYQAIHQQLNDFWRNLGVPHLDLLPLFEDHRAEDLMVNPRDPHPNERAHALAAEAIAEFLGKARRHEGTQARSGGPRIPDSGLQTPDSGL